MNIEPYLKTVQSFLKTNANPILTGVIVAGTASTGFLAARAGYRSARRLAEEGADLSLKEKTKICWPLFMPAVGVGAVTIAAAVGASRVSTRRVAALASAYSISEAAFSEYREQVVAQIGKNKDLKIRDAVAQTRIDRSGDMEIEEVEDKSPCYEVMSGRYFYTTVETLRQAENKINYKLVHESYASLNEFWDSIGLTQTSIGEELGWTADRLLELHITTTLTKDGKPCLSVGYVNAPTPDYWKFR